MTKGCQYPKTTRTRTSKMEDNFLPKVNTNPLLRGRGNNLPGLTGKTSAAIFVRKFSHLKENLRW